MRWGSIRLTPVTTVIEALGSTSLVEVGHIFILIASAAATWPAAEIWRRVGCGGSARRLGADRRGSAAQDPDLKYGGAAVVAGQIAPYTPVGVKQTAGGYEVAFENSGSNLFSIWNTDSNGNFTSYNALSGTSTALESLETAFHQDLNGDSVFGIPAVKAPSGAYDRYRSRRQ